jgi:cation transport regulator
VKHDGFDGRSGFEALPAALYVEPSKQGGRMPYEVNADLPPSVRAHLPEHAQDIFREAFNHGHAAHAHDSRQEEAAFRIAWAAVKRQYEKIGDEWVRKD